MSNLKSVALTVLELLALNAQKFRGSRHVTLATPPFKNFLRLHARTVPVNIWMSNLKSVALTILNWSDWPVRCAQTHTPRERKQYLRHSLRSLGGDKKCLQYDTACLRSKRPKSWWLFRSTSMKERHTSSLSASTARGALWGKNNVVAIITSWVLSVLSGCSSSTVYYCTRLIAFILRHVFDVDLMSFVHE